MRSSAAGNRGGAHPRSEGANPLGVRVPEVAGDPGVGHREKGASTGSNIAAEIGLGHVVPHAVGRHDLRRRAGLPRSR